MSVTKTPANLYDLRRLWIGRKVRGSATPEASRVPDRLVESIIQNAKDNRYCAVSVGDGAGEQVIADSPGELHRLLCQLAALAA